MSLPRNVEQAAQRLGVEVAEGVGMADLMRQLLMHVHDAVRVGKGDANPDPMSIINPKDQWKKQDILRKKKQDILRKKQKQDTRDIRQAPVAQPAPAAQPAAKKSKPARPALVVPTGPKKKRSGMKKPVLKSQRVGPPDPNAPKKKPIRRRPSSAPSPAPAAPAAPPERPRRGKDPSSGVRARRPSDVLPEADKDVEVKVAARDAVVKGIMNGKPKTLLLSKGEQYHLRKSPQGVQLIRPGLFGKFYLDNPGGL